MDESLIEKIDRISESPGVYLMKDDSGNVIYAGKAGNLKKRLSYYFKETRPKDLKTSLMVKKIADFEIIITGTEKEALILESALIKKNKPRYNVILKDDKRYPSLCMNINDPFPNLLVVRKIKKDGNLYFGPYSSANAVRETIKVIYKTFKLRKCKKAQLPKRSRPCLNYQMKTCLAPCCLPVDKNYYNEMVKEVSLFLKGKTTDLIRKIKLEMNDAAKIQNFENAAELRDKMFALERTLEKQIIVAPDLKDRDVLGIVFTPSISVVTILAVRNGVLMGSRNFKFNETLATQDEFLESFIKQYYEKAYFIPQEILVSIPVESPSALEDYIFAITNEKAQFHCPIRGEKKQLVNMAVENAKKAFDDIVLSDNKSFDILSRLQKRLDLKKIPRRIECFDNSNLFGKNPVSAMAVFENAKPEKSSYRRYNINNVLKPDDYACMSEILKRRFKKEGSHKPLPDLLMVDGGKGQLNITYQIIIEINLKDEFDIIAIAKKDEKRGEVQDKIYKPGRVNHVNFGNDHDLLLFLQMIRDESHRFAISFHRKKRSVVSLRSALDCIPGIGKKRKKALINNFKTIKKVRAASLEDLCKAPGMNEAAARSIIDYFKG